MHYILEGASGKFTKYEVICSLESSITDVSTGNTILCSDHESSNIRTCSFALGYFNR